MAGFADIDVAFEAGVKTAFEKRCGLLLMRTRVGTRAGWLCAYPPASVGPTGIAVWAAKNGFSPQDGDRFLDFAEVSRAAADLASDAGMPRPDG